MEATSLGRQNKRAGRSFCHPELHRHLALLISQLGNSKLKEGMKAHIKHTTHTSPVLLFSLYQGWCLHSWDRSAAGEIIALTPSSWRISYLLPFSLLHPTEALNTLNLSVICSCLAATVYTEQRRDLYARGQQRGNSSPSKGTSGRSRTTRRKWQKVSASLENVTCGKEFERHEFLMPNVNVRRCNESRVKGRGGELVPIQTKETKRAAFSVFNGLWLHRYSMVWIQLWAACYHFLACTCLNTICESFTV